MKCECGGRMIVTEIREGTAGIIRRRVCKVCRKEIYTREIVLYEDIGRALLSQNRREYVDSIHQRRDDRGNDRDLHSGPASRGT